MSARDVVGYEVRDRVALITDAMQAAGPGLAAADANHCVRFRATTDALRAPMPSL